MTRCDRCGVELVVGPCQRAEHSCNHALTCPAHGEQAIESWNLTIAQAQHDKARGRLEPAQGHLFAQEQPA